jgi:MFS transporter, PPP family, 3-phenylpropionic acid transporter
MPNSLTLRLALFTAAIASVIGVQLAFWPLWLAARGLDATEIGAVLALGTWVRVVTTPLAGMLADRSGDRRRVMVPLAVASLVGYACFIPAHGFAALVVISTASSGCFSALWPLGDNVILSAQVDYGRVKLWGSLTFLLITLLIGRILVGQPPDSLLVMLLLAGAFVVGASWALPPSPVVAHRGKPGAWRELLHTRHLWFLAAATLIQASHSVYYAFGSIHWRALGYETDVIGWLWAEGVIAEVILFYWSAGLVRRIRPSHLMAVGGLAGILRWGVLGSATSLPAFIAVQCLHALTFAAAHLGAMHYMVRNMPPDRAATVMAIYSAVVGGIGFGLVSLFSGALYQEIGGQAYFVMAAMAGGGAVCAIRLARLERFSI